jgi:hypothetical protein
MNYIVAKARVKKLGKASYKLGSFLNILQQKKKGNALPMTCLQPRPAFAP